MLHRKLQKLKRAVGAMSVDEEESSPLEVLRLLVIILEEKYMSKEFFTALFPLKITVGRRVVPLPTIVSIQVVVLRSPILWRCW